MPLDESDPTPRKQFSHLGWLAFALLLAGLFIPLPGGVTVGQCVAELPPWFTRPGDSAGMAVGYSRPYFIPQSSYDEAFEDASRRLWADRDCIIQATSASVTSGGRTTHMGGVYEVLVDTTGYAAFSESLLRVDSLWTGNLVAMLVDLPEIRDSNPDNLGPSAASPSDWYTASYEVPLYHYWTSSLLEAEALARKELTFYTAVHVRGEQRVLNDLMLKTVDLQARTHFRGIRTLTREIDPVGGTCRITVGVPPEGVHLLAYQEGE